MMYTNYQQGFIGRIVILAIVLFLIASFFSFDIQSFVESPATQKNWSYVVVSSKYIWEEFLKEPTLVLWNSVFVGAIKQAFAITANNVKAIYEKKPENLQFLPVVPDALVPNAMNQQSTSGSAPLTQ